jgi:hypothetical protein
MFANALPNYDDLNMHEAFYGAFFGEGDTTHLKKLRSFSKFEDGLQNMGNQKTSYVQPIPLRPDNGESPQFRMNFGNNMMSLSRASSFKPFTKKELPSVSNELSNSNSNFSPLENVNYEALPMQQKFSLHQHLALQQAANAAAHNNARS